MLLRLHLIAVMICIACYANSQSRSIEHTIEFVSDDGVNLSGHLFLPGQQVRYPVVIVLHAASEGIYNASFYNHLVNVLTKQNVAVFVYDRRGSGRSGGDFNTAGFVDLAKDGAAALNALTKNPNIDNKKIHLFGISQGGWVAPILYHLRPESVKSLMLISACATTPAEQMDNGSARELTKRGFSKQVVDTAMMLRYTLNQYFREKATRDSAQRVIDSYRNRGWFEFAYLPRNGLLPETPSGKWKLEMDFDGTKYMNINVPVTLAWGSNDKWVPVDKSMKIWKDALEKAGNQSAVLKVFPGVSHMMTKEEYDRDRTNEFVQQYVRLLKEWAGFINQ